VFWFLQLFSDAFLNRRRIQWYIIINARKSSRKVPVVLIGFYWNFDFFIHL